MNRKKTTGLVAALGLSLALGSTAAVLPTLSAQAAPSDAGLVKLETNATSQALGLDDATPMLSWNIDSDERGTMQSSYRIVVATTASRAQNGQGNVWDSGKVDSDATVVDYTGPSLKSRTRYYWSVKSWVPGETAWSEPTWFETGYLDESEWGGSWIAGAPRSTTTGTTAEGQADDVALLPDTTLAASAAAGASNLKVTNVNGFSVGQQIVVGLGASAQTVTVDSVGTAAVRTVLAAPAASGAERIYLNSVTGLAVGGELKVGSSTVTITNVGTAAGNASRTLAADVAAGDITIKVNNTGGFTAGQPVLIGSGDTSVIRTAVAVGTAGATGTGITLDAAVGATFASGASARGLGSGVGVSALSAATAQGAAAFAPGSGVGINAPLDAAREEGVTVRRAGNGDVCRPVGNSPNAGVCKPVRPTFLMRKSFQVPALSAHGKVVRARLYSSGLGFSEPSINGRKTQPAGHLNPGFTDYQNSVQYTTDDVTALIQQAPSGATQNVLASEIGAGRYNSETVPSNHRFETAQWRAQETLRADLWLTYADGTEQLVKSDDSWKTSIDGPTRYNDFDNGETYDARKVIPGWNTAAYNATSWANTRFIDGPQGELISMVNEPTELVAEHEGPFYSWRTPEGALAFDTERQRIGWAKIAVWGAEPGQVIRVQYIERRNDDLSIDDPNVPGTGQDGALAPPGSLQQGYYVSDGTGTEANPEIFEMNWNFAGFQWVQIDGNGGAKLPDNVKVDVKSVQEVRTAFDEVGTFETNVDLLNKIYANVRGSVSADWINGYSMDTPTYEKDGWTGDAQIILPTVANIFDIQRNLQKLSRDATESQWDDGQVGLLIPGAQGYGYCSPSSTDPTVSYVPCGTSPSLNVFKSTGNGATPIWDAYLMVLPWENYNRYDDLTGAKTAYPSMIRYLDNWIQGGKPYSQGPGGWFVRDGSEDWTLSTHLGDWAFVTGADGNAAEGTNLNVGGLQAASGTAFTAYIVKLTADMARLLAEDTGDDSYLADAARYDELFENIRADFNKRWWDEERGFYAENPTQELRQGFQAWAIGFGLVEEGNREALMEKLARDVAVTRSGHMMIGFVGMRWMWPVLTEAAHLGVPHAKDALFAVAQQTTYPSYGYHIGLGYTGVGEYWEASTRTRNHQFQGSIGQWFYEELAGIKQAAPGFKEITVRPLIGSEYGVDEVAATHESLHGLIKSSWKDSEDELVMDVTIPANTTARVHVPAEVAEAITESGTGTASPAASAPGVTLVGPENDAIVFEIGSGTYRFTVDKDYDGPTGTPTTVPPTTGPPTTVPPTTVPPVTPKVRVKDKVRAGTMLKIRGRDLQVRKVSITLGGRKLGSARVEDGRFVVTRRVPKSLSGKTVLRVLDRNGEVLVRATVRVVRRKAA